MYACVAARVRGRRGEGCRGVRWDEGQRAWALDTGSGGLGVGELCIVHVTGVVA